MNKNEEFVQHAVRLFPAFKGWQNHPVAAVLNINERTARRWAYAESTPPESVLIALRGMK